MGHAHAPAGHPLAQVAMTRRRAPDDHPLGRRGGSPRLDECSTMSPPIGPPERRPTPSRWLRTSRRGRVRLDRGLPEEPSRNRRPRAHRDLLPEYACRFEDSRRPVFSSLRFGSEGAKTLSTARSIDGRPMSLLLRGGLIITQDDKRRLVSGDILVEDGRIVAVGEADRAADEVIDCSGGAVLPGFINLHHHVANTLLRGVADDVPLEELLPRASAIDAKLTRRDVQIGALLGCVEMIRSGTTSFHDLFYWEDEVARAARESGMRGFLSWVTLDDAFTTQHGSPLKNADAFVAKQKDDPLVTPSVGVQGVYVASEETYAKAKEIADRRDVRLHTHLSETRGEVEAHRKKTGLRPVEWLEKIGFLGERVTAAHCTWVTMNEVRALARCGVSVAHCPVSNMKLASGGVAPVPEMLEAGVVARPRAASPLSNNRIVVVGGIQGAPPLAKATPGDARGKPAQTVLDLATIHAARALHVEQEIGSIEVGKRADLAVVSLKGAHTTPFYPESVIRHLVYSGRGSDVRATIVDGKVLMAAGGVRNADAGGGA